MAKVTGPNRRTALHEQVWAEWNDKYEKPRAEGLIVGFTGIDPDRKQSEGGSGTGGGLTEAQVRAICPRGGLRLPRHGDRGGV